jgi:hypothetical protein
MVVRCNLSRSYTDIPPADAIFSATYKLCSPIGGLWFTCELEDAKTRMNEGLLGRVDVFESSQP